MNHDDPRHGTPAGGRVHREHGEKPCRPCAEAEARYERGRQLDLLLGRPRAISSLGTRRRVQALVAIGHTFSRIGDALDLSQSAANALAHRDGAYMRTSTAARVARLYDAWSMTLPPETTPLERRNAAYARTIARKHGWAPPLAWDDIDNDLYPHLPDDTDPPISRHDVDEVVVYRFLAGEHLPTTLGERRAIAEAWVAAGRSLNELARRTGWKVDRYYRIQAGAA